MNALVFGEVLWDVYPTKKFIGGAPLNFAAHLVKCNNTAYLVSAVGSDTLGEETLECIKSFGVKTDYVTVNDKQTGICKVTLDENSVPTYNLLSNVAYDYITAPQCTLSGFDILYFGTLALRQQNNINTLKHILSANSFRDVFVDINVRKPYISAEVVNFSLESATILKISDEELPTVFRLLDISYNGLDSALQTLATVFSNLKLIILTKGANGSVAFDVAKNKFYSANAQKVNVISTVGAGDSFSAAFLSKYICGYDIKNALEFASKISGIVVSSPSAIPDYTL